MPVNATGLCESGKSGQESTRIRNRRKRAVTPAAVEVESVCPENRNVLVAHGEGATTADLSLDTDFDNVFCDGPLTAPLREAYCHEIRTMKRRTSWSETAVNRPRTRSACALPEQPRSQSTVPKRFSGRYYGNAVVGTTLYNSFVTPTLASTNLLAGGAAAPHAVVNFVSGCAQPRLPCDPAAACSNFSSSLHVAALSEQSLRAAVCPQSNGEARFGASRKRRRATDRSVADVDEPLEADVVTLNQSIIPLNPK